MNSPADVMHFRCRRQWSDVAKLTIAILLFALAVGIWAWRTNEPLPVKTITAQEMAIGVPDFDLSFPHLPIDESSKRMIELALRDAESEGYDCFFNHAFFCRRSAFHIYIFMLKDRTDTHLVYRVDGGNRVLIDKAIWGIYQMIYPDRPPKSRVPPATPSIGH